MDQPAFDPSLRTPRLLLGAGYDWHGDTLNDDMPYVVTYPTGSIVAFPNNTEVNDLPMYMRHGNSPRMFRELFDDWLRAARERESGPARVDPAIHAHVFGRLLGLSMYEDLVKVAKESDDIWIGTRSEAVSHVRAVLSAANGVPA